MAHATQYTCTYIFSQLAYPNKCISNNNNLHILTPRFNIYNYDCHMSCCRSRVRVQTEHPHGPGAPPEGLLTPGLAGLHPRGQVLLRVQREISIRKEIRRISKGNWRKRKGHMSTMPTARAGSKYI
jgi:hypothetical protein